MGLVNERLQLFFVANVAGNGRRGARTLGGIEFSGHSVTLILFAA